MFSRTASREFAQNICGKLWTTVEKNLTNSAHSIRPAPQVTIVSQPLRCGALLPYQRNVQHVRISDRSEIAVRSLFGVRFSRFVLLSTGHSSSHSSRILVESW